MRGGVRRVLLKEGGKHTLYVQGVGAGLRMPSCGPCKNDCRPSASCWCRDHRDSQGEPTPCCKAGPLPRVAACWRRSVASLLERSS